MKIGALKAVKSGVGFGSLILIAFGMFGLLAASVAWYGGSSGNRALSAADSEVAGYLQQASARLAALQQRLSSPVLQRAAAELIATADNPAEALVGLLRSDGLTGVINVRIAPPTLEDWSIDHGSDYIGLDMLLEARRIGTAPPELRAGTSAETPVLLFAQRVQDGEQIRALILVEMVADALTRNWQQPDGVDYVSLGQQRGSGWIGVWSHGSRPGAVPDREPLSNSRLELQWFHSQPLPLFTSGQIAGIAGVGLLMLAAGVLLRRRSWETDRPEGSDDSAPASPKKAEAAPRWNVDDQRLREGQTEPAPVSLSAPAPEPEAEAEPEPEPEPAGVFFLRQGVVGNVEQGLDVQYATLLAHAIASLAKERGLARLAIARDGRLQGPVLLEAVVQGMRAAGIQVVQLGALPASLLRFASMELADRSAVMVGDSLKPAGWNGLRVMLDGQTLDGRVILDRLRQLDLQAADAPLGELTTESAIVARYIERVSSRIQLERSLKVVVDCANGVCGLVLPRLLEAIGAEVIPLYADVDGQFPNHPPDPMQVDHLNDLRLCVRSFNADVGMAFDGDGERLNLIASDGSILWPDRVLMLLARDLLAREPGAVIVQDACCSPRLRDWVEQHGGRSERVGAGPAAVEVALAEHGACLAGTGEGHLFVESDQGVVRDVLLAACRMLEILAADTREMTGVFQEFPTVVNSPPLRLEVSGLELEEVLRKIAEAGGTELRSDVYGVTMVAEDAWAGLGIDENERAFWFRVEAQDEHAAQRMRQRFGELLKQVDARLVIPV